MNVVVAGSFCFQTSRNEWGSSFDGMTGMKKGMTVNPGSFDLPSSPFGLPLPKSVCCSSLVPVIPWKEDPHSFLLLLKQNEPTTKTFIIPDSFHHKSYIRSCTVKLHQNDRRMTSEWYCNNARMMILVRYRHRLSHDWIGWASSNGSAHPCLGPWQILPELQSHWRMLEWMIMRMIINEPLCLVPLYIPSPKFNPMWMTSEWWYNDIRMTTVDYNGMTSEWYRNDVRMMMAQFWHKGYYYPRPPLCANSVPKPLQSPIPCEWPHNDDIMTLEWQ